MKVDEKIEKYLKEKTLDVFAKHQIAIARKTLKMNDIMAKVMGGMTKDEARAVLKKYGLKEETLKEGSGPAPILKQLGPNFIKIFIYGRTLWFSYETLVAFSPAIGGKIYATSEKYSNTTTKQLNTIGVTDWVDDKTFLELARKMI